MQYSEKKMKLSTRLGIVGFVFLILFLTGYYFGYLRENCGQDKECFNAKLNSCKPAEFLNIRNNNVYIYRSANNFMKYCKLNIKLARTAVGTDPDVVKLLEGKSMSCNIPKTEIKNLNIDEVNDVLKYCHGELKEGLYELIINRMYTYLIAQLNPIKEEVDKLKKV